MRQDRPAFQDLVPKKAKRQKTRNGANRERCPSSRGSSIPRV